MLTDKQLGKLKDELLERKEQLQRHLDNDKETLHNQSEQERYGELNTADNHPADLGTELYEREKGFALDEHAQSEMEKVQEALSAMEDGTYGECKVCGKEIEYGRLEVLPTTLYCVKDTPEKSLAGDRPVEEEILTPPKNDSYIKGRREEVIDYQDSFQEAGRYGTSETPSDFQGTYEDYDSMYQDGVNSNDGNTEDIDSFSATDIEGKDRKVIPNDKMEKYEENLDREEIESPLGNIPYKKGDSYVSDKKK
ncbi:TraR/DksA C4-type zinc finger protein [Rossellomorea aquimaris]|uniref:Molecular chaperone DnaK n=1 Tax=Rossellomorea aquimaris TaxID=189382 RepID=A0A5D4TB94_9BACI|nr:TraR/DksA C4-type zinc finger protein [Rossellomorea aquimaris]TYS72599.1 molecular chaperone DnaK [Rossellomorea aquimaris]